MKISTKGRYALRMLLDMAQHREEGYISLRSIAERQGISKIYLEQIVAILKNTDILNSNRGFQGGYKLAKSPAACTVGDILRLTEGNLAPVACLEEGAVPCVRRSFCPTIDVWTGLERIIAHYLDGITLQDLLERRPGAPITLTRLP
ncbi:MAG: Rrf2 family transcriptional regulator [Deltaproteobacteria bacterium]|nr:Rrf2 family transcriptional regulator [Deltaproteobacteria bacterium]